MEILVERKQINQNFIVKSVIILVDQKIICPIIITEFQMIDIRIY